MYEVQTKSSHKKWYRRGEFFYLLGLVLVSGVVWQLTGLVSLGLGVLAVGGVGFGGFLLWRTWRGRRGKIRRRGPLSIPVEASRRRRTEGKDGQARMDQYLAKLPRAFHVLREVQYPGGMIHRIVVGPTGVFVLHAQHDEGEVSMKENGPYLNGRPLSESYAARLFREAFWVKDVIKETTGMELYIRPVLTFTRAFVMVTRPYKGMHIVSASYLPKFLKKQRDSALSRKQVEQIRQAIEQAARRRA